MAESGIQLVGVWRERDTLKGSSCNLRRHSTEPLGNVPEAGGIYRLMRAAKVKSPNVVTRALLESLGNP